MSDVINLENSHWQIGIVPQTGGSIAYGRIHSRAWLDFMRPTPVDGLSNPSLCSSFVLVPWSNRIRDGLFTFRGIKYQLQRNGKDGTAIHGVGRNLPWAIEHYDPAALTLTLDTQQHANVNWPFRITARQRFAVEDRMFVVQLSVRNESDSPMPAGIGQHPYFQKSMSGAHVALEIPYSLHLPLENGLPARTPDENFEPFAIVPEIVDFRKRRPLAATIADHCLTGRLGSAPVHMEYPGVATIAMHSDPIFQHLIFYAPPGKDFYAVEPVSNLNDGFNLDAHGLKSAGVFVLNPGEEAMGTIRFEIELTR